MSEYSILVVEDQIDYGEVVKKMLEKKGYQVTYQNSALQGIEQCSKHKFDLIISDLNMKFMDGIQFIAAAKAIIPTVKTILLTAYPSEQTELRSFDLNVDRYISKDKSMEVILKYVEQVLGDITTQQQEKVILFSKSEDLRIDLQAHETYLKGQLISLTPKEFALIVMFLKNKNIVLNRQQILKELWADSYATIDERAIDIHVKRLRTKLSTFSIQSVRSVGYKWSEPNQ